MGREYLVNLAICSRINFMEMRNCGIISCRPQIIESSGSWNTCRSFGCHYDDVFSNKGVASTVQQERVLFDNAVLEGGLGEAEQSVS